jgi:biopolymer transport protein ExbD
MNVLMGRFVVSASILAIAGCAAPTDVPPGPILVAVDKEGNVTVDGEVIQPYELKAALERAQTRRHEQGKE